MNHSNSSIIKRNINNIFNSTVLNHPQYNKLFGLKQFDVNTANKNMSETSFHQALIIYADSVGYAVPANDDAPERIVKGFFMGIATFLSLHKPVKVNDITSIVVHNESGEFKFAAMVEYFSNEENINEPGNYNFTMTFNKDDYEESKKHKNVKEYDSSDESFKIIIDKVCRDLYTMEVVRETAIFYVCNIVVDTLLVVCDHEAIEGQVVELNYDGYFTIAITVEDGTKVYSITPDGHLKQIIKEDVSLDNLKNQIDYV